MSMSPSALVRWTARLLFQTDGMMHVRMKITCKIKRKGGHVVTVEGEGEHPSMD